MTPEPRCLCSNQKWTEQSMKVSAVYFLKSAEGEKREAHLWKEKPRLRGAAQREGQRGPGSFQIRSDIFMLREHVQSAGGFTETSSDWRQTLCVWKEKSSINTERDMNENKARTVLETDRLVSAGNNLHELRCYILCKIYTYTLFSD